jgi:hypothetical protein
VIAVLCTSTVILKRFDSVLGNRRMFTVVRSIADLVTKSGWAVFRSAANVKFDGGAVTIFQQEICSLGVPLKYAAISKGIIEVKFMQPLLANLVHACI